MPIRGLRYRVDFTSNGEADVEVCFAASEEDAVTVTKFVWGDDVVITKISRLKIID